MADCFERAPLGVFLGREARIEFADRAPERER
jgi:hypothetical protein